MTDSQKRGCHAHPRLQPDDIGPPWTDWKRISETADLLGYGIERHPGPLWVLTRGETTTTPMSIVDLCAILESDLLDRRYRSHEPQQANSHRQP